MSISYSYRKRPGRYPAALVDDETTSTPQPSPEVAQLVLLGQLDDAAALHAKQAEIDVDAARVAVETLAS
jgi:hypothetical protein